MSTTLAGSLDPTILRSSLDALLARWDASPIDDALSALRRLAMCGGGHDH